MVYGLLLSAAMAIGQANPPQAKPAANAAQMPTFKAQAELVTVPVVVTKDGKHVTGLAKEAFTVLEDGQRQLIAVFEEVHASSGVLRAAELPAGVYSNEVVDNGGTTPLTIIVLDYLNTSYFGQASARTQVLQFLAQSAERREPTMLATLSRDGLKIVHNFTTSPAVLLKALQRVAPNLQGTRLSRAEVAAARDIQGEFALKTEIDVLRESADLESFINGPKDMFASAMAFQEQQRVETTIDAMEQLVRALAGARVRKTVLWTGGGFACDPTVTKGGLQTRAVDKCNDIWRLLSASNIVVYPILTEQPNSGAVDTSLMSAARVSPIGGGIQMVAESFARATGGKVCTFRNDDSCFRAAARDSSHYYVLAYYTQPTAKPAWRKLSVKVAATGADVRARNGYMTLGRDTIKDSEKRSMDVALAVVSPIEYTAIPLRVQWLKTAEENGRRKFGFQLQVPPGPWLTIEEADGNRMKLHIIALAVDEKFDRGGDATRDVDAHLKDNSVQQIRTQGFSYKDVLEIPAAGNYKVKFIVRDDLSGRMGTVTVPLPAANGVPQGGAMPPRFHFRAVLEDTVNAGKAKVGDAVRMTALDNEEVQSQLMIARNARLFGRVLEAKAVSSADPESRLAVLVERAEWKNHVVPLKASIVAQGLSVTTTTYDVGAQTCLSGSPAKPGEKPSPYYCPPTLPVPAVRNEGPAMRDVELKETEDGRTVLVSRKGNVVLPAGGLVLLRHTP